MNRSVSVLAILLLLSGAAVAFAQTEKLEQPRARLEFVLSKFEGDRKVSDQPLFLLLPLNQKGVLRATTPVNDLNPDTVPPCFTPRPLERSPQEIGTQVDSTVSPLPEGRFAIQISIAERAFAGCRMVGELNIPVFSNLVQDRSVTLKNGESTDFAFSVNKTANTSSRLMVKLTILE